MGIAEVVACIWRVHGDAGSQEHENSFCCASKHGNEVK